MAKKDHKKAFESMKTLAEGFLKDAEKNENFFVLAITNDGTATSGFSKGHDLEFEKVARAISSLPREIVQMAMVMNMAEDKMKDEPCDDSKCPVHGKNSKKSKK